MSEWFKEHDWKSCVRLKRTGGSNPLLCAKKQKGFSCFAEILFLCNFLVCTIFERGKKIEFQSLSSLKFVHYVHIYV